MTTPALIRPMRPEDAPELLRLMRAIVAFEGDTGFALTTADLLACGFGPTPQFGAFVAEAGAGAEAGADTGADADAGGPRLAGMAVHYDIPFMHDLRPQLMLKWLWVDPEARGRGLAQALMAALAAHAVARGLGPFCWHVLPDNHPAQRFYTRLGGLEDPVWKRWTLPAPAMARLAADAP